MLKALSSSLLNVPVSRAASETRRRTYGSLSYWYMASNHIKHSNHEQRRIWGARVEQSYVEQSGRARIAQRWQRECQKGLELVQPSFMPECGRCRSPLGWLIPIAVRQHKIGDQAQQLPKEHARRLEGRMLEVYWTALPRLSHLC